jgi:YHS domain-containing protein
MAYSVKSKKSGKTYYLHSKTVKLKGDRKQKIYYFGGEAKSNALDKLPEGYKVIENKKTGLPMLKKK